MSWKIISITLPEKDSEILAHLASMPHSWTVDHNHTLCRTQLPVCHASSHEYGPSGLADGTNQHQHFIMEATDTSQQEIAKAHRVFTHSREYCKPDTCKTVNISHSTDHKLCYGAWCEPIRKIVMNNSHNSGWHAPFCTPKICPIMTEHELGNHGRCFH